MSARCLVRGSINVDEFFHVQNVVLPGQTIASTNFERRGGGKGANQAAAVARANAPVSLVGAVGEDGEWLVRVLRDMGVAVDDVLTVKEEPTGRAIIQLTPAGENCIILHKGANYARNDTTKEIHQRLREITHLLVQNEVPMPVTLAYLHRAHERGIATVYNPSPMPSDAELRSFPWTHIAWLLVNEGEAQHLSRVLDASTAPPASDLKDPRAPYGAPSTTDLQIVQDAQRTVARLAAHPSFSSTAIVCTLGGSGVLASIPALPQPIYLPASRLEGGPKDTTGAGDCFTGFFVAGLMRVYGSGDNGHSLGEDDAVQLLRVSARAAGMCVEKPGALESIPSYADVQARLTKTGQ
ncbi:Ribokinase-like protein [Amylostereum chailletii]|nr:Ribokinase-like protein [Amylostereum chailletii]